MIPKLRPDQSDTLRKVSVALRDYQSVLLRGECGFGKTVCAAYMAASAEKRGKRVVFGVHRRELAWQTSKTFEAFGIRHSFIAAGMTPDPFAPVQIALANTLANRPSWMKCDLFIPDEAHLWCSPTREEIISTVRGHGASIVPLTATPSRIDGKGLASIADHMVEGPTVSWLIENGLLARYKVYAPSSPDLSGLHTRAGDYVVSEVNDLLGKPRIIGDRVAAYVRYANGRRMIGYAYSREDGEATAEDFRRAGIASEFIDGETPDTERRAAIMRFATGETKVLINCQLFREGFDLSAQVGMPVPIQAVGLWTPTQSLQLAVQMMMRTLRAQDGHAVLLDHVNLMASHGLPDDDRVWTLEGRERRKGGGSSEPTLPVVKCGRCFYMARSFDVCPSCGEAREVKSRQVEAVDGELAELDVEAVRRARKTEQARARTFDDLVRLGAERGYSNPSGWARHMISARGGR